MGLEIETYSQLLFEIEEFSNSQNVKWGSNFLATSKDIDLMI